MYTKTHVNERERDPTTMMHDHDPPFVFLVYSLGNLTISQELVL